MSSEPSSAEIQNRLAEVEKLLARVKDARNFQAQQERLAELERRVASAGFWEDAARAKEVITELKRIKAVVDEIATLEQGWRDAETLFVLAEEEEDAGTLAEVERESARLLKAAEELELHTLLAGDHDAGSCFLSIHAGAGGTESCDWVSMLRRMMLRWAERHRYRVRFIDELPGEETGLKSCTLHVAGAWAYGYLRSEGGVHRLVRISPFDARSRRHTSFASIDVSPEVDEVEIEIDDSDLRVDTYRSSGAGGQHVNVTDSAVRITHLPTGIVVQCQNERSQHSNRAQAMRVLRSRLLTLEIKKREEQLAKISGEKGEIAFGSQIRSYVLHPYKMVKDHRTGVETGNVDAVLDGSLDLFIEAYLRATARSLSAPPPAGEE